MPGRVLLDTNVVSQIMKGDARVVAWLQSWDWAGASAVVAGELLFGAEASANREKLLEAVEGMLTRLGIQAVSTETARKYSQVRARLKQKGTPIPENDVWIAAGALEAALPLASYDGHFAYVEGLEVIVPPGGTGRPKAR